MWNLGQVSSSEVGRCRGRVSFRATLGRFRAMPRFVPHAPNLVEVGPIRAQVARDRPNFGCVLATARPTPALSHTFGHLWPGVGRPRPWSRPQPGGTLRLPEAPNLGRCRAELARVGRRSACGPRICTARCEPRSCGLSAILGPLQTRQSVPRPAHHKRTSAELAPRHVPRPSCPRQVGRQISGEFGPPFIPGQAWSLPGNAELGPSWASWKSVELGPRSL